VSILQLLENHIDQCLVYARYTLPVFTARKHGRHFWTPVNTGHRDRQALLLMMSWLFSPCRTDVQNDSRVHCPWTRGVCTGLYPAVFARVRL